MRKINEEIMRSFNNCDLATSFVKDKSRLSVNEKRKSECTFESPDPSKKIKPNEDSSSDVAYSNLENKVIIIDVTSTPHNIVEVKSNSDSIENKITPELSARSDEADKISRNKEDIALNSLRKNLNPEFTESLDTMLSKSKKKVSKIAEEKRLSKELETKIKAEELSKIKTKDILFKFDNDIFAGKK